jgi:hypothetical protein
MCETDTYKFTYVKFTLRQGRYGTNIFNLFCACVTKMYRNVP